MAASFFCFGKWYYSHFNNSIARQRGLGLCPSEATVEGGYAEETSAPLSFN